MGRVPRLYVSQTLTQAGGLGSLKVPVSFGFTTLDTLTQSSIFPPRTGRVYISLAIIPASAYLDRKAFREVLSESHSLPIAISVNPPPAMSRSIFAPLFACTVLFLAVSFPVQAQEDLVRPEGWQVRFDNPEASEDQLEMFVSMPPGWHVTSGPAAVYWGPDMEASGEYRIEMEVYLFDPAGRLEAFGIFVGGQDLMGDAIEYTYFLLRDGGEFIVKRREGPEAPTIHAWTGHDAILGWADREEEASTVKNVLAIEAGAETVRFFVNDAEVAALPRANLGMDGVFGMRVNHALNLHISRLETVAMGDGQEEK